MSTRGRKRVIGSVFETGYAKQKEVMSFFSKYIFTTSMASLFTKGKIEIDIDGKDEIIILSYINESKNIKINSNIPIQMETRREYDEMKYTIQEFILDNYFYHEWDGERMKNKDLAKLLGVTPQAMDQEIGRVFARIRENYGDKLGIVERAPK